MMDRRFFTIMGLSAGAASLAGCATMPGEPGYGEPAEPNTPPPTVDRPRRPITRTISRPDYDAVYGPYPGEKFPIKAVDWHSINPRYLRQTVEFPWKEPPGSVVIDGGGHHLYFVESEGVATRYGVGVGKEGFGWSGPARINMKRDWPDWVPPREMVARDPQIRAQLEPTSRGMGVRGGVKSPLGARAMYLFGEGRDLGYRIHGTLEPYTVGENVSSGCIRLINQDIVHLYTRAALGTPVTVLG